MNVLVDQAVRNYDYISRYNSIFYYFNTEDQKYMYGLSKQLSLDNEYALHEVKQGDNLDSLAYKYYGRPDLFWVIADFNRIQDCLTPLWGNYKSLKIPNITRIKFIN